MHLVNLTIAASVLISVIGGVGVLLLRLLLPEWWRRKTIRLPILLLPLLAILSAAVWAYGFRNGPNLLVRLGSILTPALLVLELAVLISLIPAGIINSVNRSLDFLVRRPGNERVGYSVGRRRILRVASAAIPTATLASALTGITDSYGSIRVPQRRIPIVGLPDDLHGFKIAHLSDPHLGYYLHLDDLESVIETIKPEHLDMVLVTGDISDDLKLLPDALRIIDTLTPRYGIYASVGNHEYYRGITDVLNIFRDAPFPMLINSHVNINIGRQMVQLGGADDPRTLRRDNSEFLRHTIERTMGNLSPDSFKLLMCHRPEGFDHSAKMGVNLVLAGHTHGGQIGFGGRSVFEPVFPEKYLWGIYQRGATTLFTSGGMGHWFPFRLGVPAEAPILTLERSEAV